MERCPLKPSHYYRYLDDIWGTWEYTTEEFQDFITILNTHHRTISVRYVTDMTQIDFLDITTYKGKDFDTTGKLDLKVFFKATDTHALLHKSSFHPPHCFSGIVKSQLLRFKRICTQKKDFETACKILFKALRERGYTRTYLRKAYSTFEEVKIRDQRPRLALVTTYSSQSILANKRLKSNFENRHNNLLQDYKIISAYRKNKNLKDYLVRSNLKQSNRATKPTPSYFSPQKQIINRTSKSVIGIKQIIPYNTQNVIYLITCDICKLQYIGETGNSIACRLNQHRYNINNHKETHLLIVKHYLTHGIQALKVCGLEHNRNWTVGERKFQEKEWIKRLDTRYPGGLNL